MHLADMLSSPNLEASAGVWRVGFLSAALVVLYKYSYYSVSSAGRDMRNREGHDCYSPIVLPNVHAIVFPNPPWNETDGSGGATLWHHRLLAPCATAPPLTPRNSTTISFICSQEKMGLSMVEDRVWAVMRHQVDLTMEAEDVAREQRNSTDARASPRDRDNIRTGR